MRRVNKLKKSGNARICFKNPNISKWIIMKNNVITMLSKYIKIVYFKAKLCIMIRSSFLFFLDFLIAFFYLPLPDTLFFPPSINKRVFSDCTYTVNAEFRVRCLRYLLQKA